MPEAWNRAGRRPGGLRPGIEHRVPTTDVGQHQVVFTTRITQVNPVAFAGSAAVTVAVPVREKACKHTVLDVKNGQVLMRDHLESCAEIGGQGACERSELVTIEIVGEGQPLQAVF